MRVTLPSGVTADLGPSEAALEPISGIFAGELAGARATLRKGGEELELRALPLSDFHSLRAILRKTGEIDEPAVKVHCRNCGRVFEVEPSATFELGPYRDAELDDPELDAPFDFDHDYPIDPELPEYASVRLQPVSVGDALPFFDALTQRFRATSQVVRAMGVVSLGDTTTPARIARRLNAASEETFDRIGAVFEDAHYPPRLSAPHACPKCGVVEWLAVPAERELTVASSEAPAPAHPEAFPDLDAFEERVRVLSERVYRELGVQAIGLSIVEGPAACDDAGEPLLGCYDPPDPEGLIPRGAEIKVFYRTFRAMWEDGAYDVDAEIEETVRHEIEHHFGFLAGSDPLDDHERAEIGHETARRIGRRETQRRAVSAVAGDVSDFWRRTWPLWLIAALATLLAVASAR